MDLLGSAQHCWPVITQLGPLIQRVQKVVEWTHFMSVIVKIVFLLSALRTADICVDVLSTQMILLLSPAVSNQTARPLTDTQTAKTKS